VVLHNAANPAAFFADRPRGLRRGRVRLISTAWSTNVRKGGAFYRWLDAHLDWTRYEYTFVGRVEGRFRNIRILPPMAAPGLGAVLREHDVYITASQCDPCSNALIEALSCGLPALYLDDGGHPELVQQGGEGFSGGRDVLAKLESVAAHYETYRRLINPPSMRDVAGAYVDLLEAICDTRPRRGSWG